MTKQRAYSLDALRGTAILLMVLSGILPYTLPHWMFHAQVPPGQAFDPLLPGITWVDLVFPFFLFCLGASLPFALEKRRLSDRPVLKLGTHIIERGFLLVFFAIFVQHIRPYNLSDGIWDFPTDYGAWFLGLLGFAILFAIYVRPLRSWSRRFKILLKGLGWTAAILFLIFARYKDGSGFTPERMDIIIMLLANMSVFGSLIYLFTRKNILGRIFVMAIFIAMRLVHMQLDIVAAIGGQEAVRNIPYVMHLFNGVDATWIDRVWNATPAGWLYNFSWLKYLLIVLPGSIAGDQIKSWMELSVDNGMKMVKGKLIAFAVLSVLFIPVCLIGLYSRDVTVTTFICFAMIVIGQILLRKENSNNGKFLKILFTWGAAWLALGLILEPFGGGIKKDNSTLSYYLLTSGLAYFALIFFTVMIDILRKKRFFNLLILNGKNPMIAYVGMYNFILPILYITAFFPMLKNILTSYPWLGFLLAMVQTFVLAWFVSIFSKRKIVWRT